VFLTVIHGVQTNCSTLDIEIIDVLNTYQALTHERDITPYQWPLITIARLFWIYTVCITKEASSTDKLAKKLAKVQFPVVNQHGGRISQLDGLAMIEDADRRAPNEYHALVKEVEVWCTKDMVSLNDQERSAWSALQLAVLVLWEMRDS
jgi:hypothetical protein